MLSQVRGDEMPKAVDEGPVVQTSVPVPADVHEERPDLVVREALSSPLRPLPQEASTRLHLHRSRIHDLREHRIEVRQDFNRTDGEAALQPREQHSTVVAVAVAPHGAPEPERQRQLLELADEVLVGVLVSRSATAMTDPTFSTVSLASFAHAHRWRLW